MQPHPNSAQPAAQAQALADPAIIARQVRDMLTRNMRVFFRYTFTHCLHRSSQKQDHTMPTLQVRRLYLPKPSRCLVKPLLVALAALAQSSIFHIPTTLSAAQTCPPIRVYHLPAQIIAFSTLYATKPPFLANLVL